MYTLSDFTKIIESNIDDYPAVAVLYRAGDPRIFSAIKSIAQMSSMLSEQIELASAEVFEKSRDTTVLADAALKGILPKATPTTVSIRVTNSNSDAFTVNAGRSLLDSTGREYSVIETVTLDGGSEALITAMQCTQTKINHTFTESEPFAKVEIPTPESDKYIGGVKVYDINGVEYEFAQSYTNISDGDKIYHVETDEYRRLFVVFGYAGRVGYQHSANESIVIYATETYGNISPKVSSPFVFEYASNPLESKISMKMVSVEVAGKNPPDIATLRELINYPSIYDDNAVFNGEFDRLLRKDLPTFNFLSVWNEQVEEEMRGPDVLNKNVIFVSIDPSTDAMKEEVTERLEIADDSYQVEFVEPVVSNMYISVSGSVARVYQQDSVKDQISDLLVSTYGLDSYVSKRGLYLPTVQNITTLIKSNIQAFQDSGSDFTVSLEVEQPMLPEHWHYVTSDSISTTITESNQSLNRWGR